MMRNTGNCCSVLLAQATLITLSRTPVTTKWARPERNPVWYNVPQCSQPSLVSGFRDRCRGRNTPHQCHKVWYTALRHVVELWSDTSEYVYQRVCGTRRTELHKKPPSAGRCPLQWEKRKDEKDIFELFFLASPAKRKELCVHKMAGRLNFSCKRIFAFFAFFCFILRIFFVLHFSRKNALFPCPASVLVSTSVPCSRFWLCEEVRLRSVRRRAPSSVPFPEH